MRLIETGKYKNKTLAQCPPEYLLWASKHEKNFSESNRWVSRKATELLAQMAQEKAAQEVAASKIERMESLAQNGSFLAQMDLKMTKFVATNKIADLGLKGNLYSNAGFQLMR